MELTTDEYNILATRHANSYEAAQLRDQLIAEGYSNTPGVSFTRFQLRDAGTPEARIHIHIEHVGSTQFYHHEYPGGGVPEIRWK